MADKRIKRTNQEWFDLIQDCITSCLKKLKALGWGSVVTT